MGYWHYPITFLAILCTIPIEKYKFCKPTKFIIPQSLTELHLFFICKVQNIILVLCVAIKLRCEAHIIELANRSYFNIRRMAMLCFSPLVRSILRYSIKYIFLYMDVGTSSFHHVRLDFLCETPRRAGTEHIHTVFNVIP